MASLMRTGLTNILNGTSARTLLFANTQGTTILRTISSKIQRDIENRPPKPKPWDYENRFFTFFHYLYDRTTARFDENSKIIVVDGPIAAGKSQFAKQLAKELDMVYFPEANLDMCYINSYGFDLRSLDPQVSSHCKSFDVNDFMKNPLDVRTARFQIYQHIVKYSQYIDALAHLLSTGDGIVLDRSVYSDFVFAEAMFRSGYISKAAYKKYYEFRDCTIGELLHPHLVIYLDVPVNKVLENCQKRNYSYEKNSPVLNPQYLGHMEKAYKQNYLKQMNKHCELLVYDWSDGGDVEIVVEDIERINLLPSEDPQHSKLQDWDLRAEEEWGRLRFLYADQKVDLLGYTNIPCFEVPELITDAEESEQWSEVMDAAPGETYEKGFNAGQGDKGLLFKMQFKNRGTLPRSERRTF